ncbi:uncharacterized protein LOC135130605 [Zophobas morio]|uniref:uncharacterized protein LOC135130605 n=1 Tax=Zophobas morio TaxID=2755281 RepID=UPI003082B48B
MNTVVNIKTLADKGQPRGELTEAVKAELKKLGPSRPDLVITHPLPTQRFYKVLVEKFDMEMYNLADWLCGCSQQNALFCYICLVMNGKETDILNGPSYYWLTSKTKLMEKINQHQATPQHMQCSLDYALLGENHVQPHLKNDFFVSVTQHNEKVRQNRYILSKLIDCVKYTSGESDYKAEMTQVMKESKSSVSGALFPDQVCDVLLDSIHAVCLDLIHQQIRQTDFVSLETDEVSTVGSPVKLVFIVRYELQGEIHERFLKYAETQSNHSHNVANIMLCELHKLAAVHTKPDNIISFSYDGLASIFSRRSGLHSKLKDYFKKIQFIHSYAHNIDFVVEHTGSLYKELQIFFVNLKSFRDFFSRSEKYITILDGVVANRLHGEFKTEWNFQATSPTVITLCSHKSDIDECLDLIIDVEVERSIIAEAVALKNLLDDEDFNYWVDFFAKVMPVCDELFYQMQQLKAFDAVKVRTIVENFKTEMNYVKSSIGDNVEANSPPSKKLRMGETVYIKEEVNDIVYDQAPPTQDLRQFTRTVKTNQVFNVIMAYIEERVTPSPFLVLASLVHPGFFAQYKVAFPKAEVEQVAKLFSLDKDALTAELEIIYDRHELSQAEGALSLLGYWYENQLADILPECFKLLKIVCTVPMMTSEPGRCFSTLKQIKKFLRKGEKKSDVLTVCFLEKDLMKSTPNFNELVIEHLCRQKKGDADFSRFAFQQLY